MTAPNVDMNELKRAIQEFGSLWKAIAQLRDRKSSLENSVVTLQTKSNTLEEVNRKRLDEMRQLDEAIKEYRKEFDELADQINKYGRQYKLFTSFVNMLLTSPFNNQSLEELAGYIHYFAKRGWRGSDSPRMLRCYFVFTILGNHLHCYKCQKCGIQFITNTEPTNFAKHYYCPKCGFSSGIKGDDTFLETLIGPYKTTEFK